MTLKLRVMYRAVHIRINAGEQLEDILATYPRLTEKEKEEIRKAAQAEPTKQVRRW